MAGMGGGDAGVTALLARRSWLLVRGQHRVLRGSCGGGVLPGLCGSLHPVERCGAGGGLLLLGRRRRGGVGEVWRRWAAKARWGVGP